MRLFFSHSHRTLFAPVILSGVLLFCGPATGSGKTYTIIDKMGRRVTVSVPVRRAVYLSSYDIIPVLGAWDRVAGINRWAYDHDLLRASNPNLRAIPSVGTGVDVNMESLLRLRPDIVITWTARPEAIRFMEKKGLAVISVYPDSLRELYDEIRLHGTLLGNQRKAAECIALMKDLFSMIERRTAPLPPTSRKKMLWVWSRHTSVTGANSLNAEIIRIAGGVNAAAAIPERSAEVSIEKIIRWNPEIVFIWGSAVYSPKEILSSAQWRHVNAVRSGCVYKTPEWSTWSPRLALLTLWMAMKAYPERFRDVDYDSVADAFMQKTFGVPYRAVRHVDK